METFMKISFMLLVSLAFVGFVFLAVGLCHLDGSQFNAMLIAGSVLVSIGAGGLWLVPIILMITGRKMRDNGNIHDNSICAGHKCDSFCNFGDRIIRRGQ